MSLNGSVKSSTSESSTSSNPGIYLLQKEDDFTLFGSSSPIRLKRSKTVRRASSTQVPLVLPTAEEKELSKADQAPIEQHATERYRRSLDSTYRHSLESISEYKTKSSFSSASLYPSRDGSSSMESSCSDYTDYAVKSATDANKDKTFVSASSSYLSWIESVNSEHFGSANSTTDVIDVDTKVGEWNNFWLNYNSVSSRNRTSPYLSASHEDKTVEDVSDCKSTCSTQIDFTDKQTSMDQIILSLEDALEAVRCSQRITEILQNALRRSENEIDDSRNDSHYSQWFRQSYPSMFTNLRKEDSLRVRSRSYSLEPQDLQKQKQVLKTSPNQTGNSCINVLLNSGVVDIWKRVISKRRDILVSDESSVSPASRSSFSDWSSAK